MVYDLIAKFGELSITNPLIVSAAVAVVRSIAGYLEEIAKASAANKKLEIFSVKKFLETVFRIVPQELALSATGVPGLSFLTDYALKKWKK